MGIPYQAIGIGIGFLVGVWALIEAETAEVRILILVVMALIFFLPIVWRNPISQFISFISWIIFGISCYIFIKLQKAGIR